MKKTYFRAFMTVIVISASIFSLIFSPYMVLGKEISVDKSTSQNPPVLLNTGKGTKAIYLNGASGNDSNDGSTKETAVKTFERAKEIALADKDITTVFVTGQVTINGDLSLLGTNAFIKRDSSYNGFLFFVHETGVVTLSNITIDGNSEFAIKAERSLINCKGTLNIEDGTILQNNKIGSENYARKYGGAVYGNGNKCVVNMSGGLMQHNSATYGGAILVYKGAKFNMSGGTIQNNQAINGPTPWNDAAAGGGVCVYEGGTFNFSGGIIKDNSSEEMGGGISIGTMEVSQGNNYLNMTGGTVDGNSSGATGGGIFVQAAYGNRVSRATISAGYITNNRMNGTGHTNFKFGGGGIYINGFDAEGFKNGELYLTNAVITENTAEIAGGGYAACPITNTKIYLKDGCAIYSNQARSARDIFIYSATEGMGAHGGNPSYLISDTMLGGVPYNWKYNDGTEVALNSLNGRLMGEDVDFSLQTDSVGNDNTKALAKVYITGNHSVTRGGGIGTNGNVTIGASDEVIDLQANKVWDDNNDEKKIRPESIEVELWRKIAGSSEEAVYIGYEKIEPDQNGDWSIQFENQLKQDGLGNDYEYIIKERKISGYVALITGDMISGFEITNSYQPETITIMGEKTWEDENNARGHRPESITIRLFKNGLEIDFRVVTKAEDWSWTFKDLPKYENDQLIEYTIEEDPVPGYESHISGYNVTNCHKDDPVPPTGDSFNPTIWVSMMVISFISIVSMIGYKNKNKIKFKTI
ncbi:MAG: Cna B-type domain-containing protein [Erysipelotrichaceae bacterium]|jgi:hypothetical protein